MSLFDDLLTKVQSPSSAVSNSTGWSGQQDPVVKINGPITISESTPIVTNQEIRTAPVEPPVIIAAPVEPPVITITEAPMIGMTPIQEESEVVNITPIQEESSVQDSSPLFDMTVPLMDNVEDENPNNFMITREDTSPFMEEWFAKNETPEIILGDDTMSSSPLFDISSDSISPSTVLSEWDSLVEDKKVEDTSYKTTSSETTYRNTKEYLKHAFEEVEVLIATIDRENDNKITIKYNGTVSFTSDSSAIEGLSPLSTLSYRNNDNALRVSSNEQGQLSFEMTENGNPLLLDARGKAFVAKAVKVMMENGAGGSR